MNATRHVIILGTGHLAFQVGRKLSALGERVLHISTERFDEIERGSLQQSSLERFREVLREAGIANARAIYALDDEDRRNIQFALIALSLNATIPIFISLFNERLAPHFRGTHHNLVIRNPALIATPRFVEALEVDDHRTPKLDHTSNGDGLNTGTYHFRENLWIWWLLCAFVILLGTATTVFHITENLSWVDALYFSTTLITTTGFGDIHLRYSSTFAKLFGVCVMLSSLVLASVVLSSIVDRLLKRRSERALGRKRHKLHNHVILCGLGRLGYQITLELLRRGKKVLVMEMDTENKFLSIVRSRGATIFIADATIPKNLKDAGVEHAMGLFSVIKDDLKNLEIGLNARSQHPTLKLVVRIFDKEIAEEMKNRLDIRHALSTSAIAAEEFAQLLRIHPVEKGV